MIMNSGVIKVGQGSCISTNNTTGGSTLIDIRGGELYSDGSYAIYSPAQEVINISGNSIVQGINARMGKITISDHAKIISTTITDEIRDDIGSNIETSGCIWFGDTIALITGTYTDPNGTELYLKVLGDASVESNFRSAVAIYAVDTKDSQDVDVKIDTINKVYTTDDEKFEAVMVYDHDSIKESATEAGKPYDPKFNSNISVIFNGKTIYPKN